MNRESCAELRLLADNVSQYVQSLAKLNQPVEGWSTILIHIVLPKLDKRSRREWKLRRSTLDEFPTLEEFLELIVVHS